MSYSLVYDFNLGVSKTGLALKAILINSQGTVVSNITTGFYEYPGSGHYLWQASMPDGFSGAVVIVDNGSGNYLTMISVNPQETENTDVKTSSLSISTSASSSFSNRSYEMAFGRTTHLGSYNIGAVTQFFA